MVRGLTAVFALGVRYFFPHANRRKLSQTPANSSAREVTTARPPAFVPLMGRHARCFAVGGASWMGGVADVRWMDFGF